MATYNLDILITAIDQASSKFKTIGGALGALGQEASDAAQSLQPLGAGLAAMSAAGSALIVSSAMTAARVEVLGTVLNTVGENAGYTTTELATFEAALMDSGITAGASRQSLIQMMQAEIDLSHATDLARLAQDAAVVANLNSSEAYEQLITGIQRGQPIILRTMGITVDFQGAYKRLAAQLGKTTTELSASEKMQARVNEVMKAGGAISGVYEAAMGNVGKKLGSLKGDFQDAANVLGRAYLPAMEGVVDTTRSALGWFTELDEGTQRNIATFLGLGTAITGAGGALILATPKIIALGSSVVALGSFASNTAFALQLLAAGSNVAGLGIAGATASALAIVGPLAAAAAGAAALYVAFDKLGESADVIRTIPPEIDALTAASLLLDEQTMHTQTEIDEMAASLRDAGQVSIDVADGWTSQYSPALVEARQMTDGWATSMEMATRTQDELNDVTLRASQETIDYTGQLDILKQAVAGPVAKANDDYISQQDQINARIAETKARLIELGEQHGDYDTEIRETEGTLRDLNTELWELDASHREVMNRIVYDMMLARLATDGWTSAETELALEVARSMGIIDTETWAAATSMNEALDSFVEGESVPNTITAILGIGDELAILPETASTAGSGMAGGLQPGIDALSSGIHHARDLKSTIDRIPRDVRINVAYTGTHGATEGYQHGTDYVPRTGLAYLHKGEAVLNQQQAQVYRSQQTTYNLTANYAPQSERSLRDDVRMMQLLSGA